MSIPHVRLNIAPEDLVAELAEVAYQVALHHGFTGPFIDFEIRLWHRFDDVVRRTIHPHGEAERFGDSAMPALSGAALRN